MAARSSGGTRKAPAKKRRKPSVPKRKVSELQRRMRDALVVELRAMGGTWEEIAAFDGRTVRTVRGVVDGWREAPPPGMLDQRPLESFEGLLRRQQLAWRIAAQTAASTGNENARVAAVKAMMAADEGVLAILQAIGHVPRNPRQLAAEEALHELARQMSHVMYDVVDGKRSPAEALEFFNAVLEPSEPTDAVAELGA